MPIPAGPAIFNEHSRASRALNGHLHRARHHIDDYQRRCKRSSLDCSGTRLRRLAGAQGVGDDSQAHFARSRTIKFCKKNRLPAAEREPPVFNPYSLGRTNERRLDVRIGIPFGVLVIAAMRNQPVKRRSDIASHAGIIALIDQYTGRGVRNKQVTDSLSAAEFTNRGFNLGGDVPELCSSRSSNG